MARPKSVFVCSECGNDTPRWQGQCPACGAWNTLTGFNPPASRDGGRRARRVEAGAATPLVEVGYSDSVRLPTGLGEFDRVLGSGLVEGSVTLLGGEPGIGKSTLLLQAAASLSGQVPVLYATGEESLQQVALRGRRLGVQASTLHLAAETSVERVIETARGCAARVLVVDSIQTMSTEALESAPGSVSQLRESAARLVEHAKGSGTSVILIGHVTKEGALAGPRVLEHMVDTVLYFESDAGSRYRIVRAVKNRFGAANEIGVFAMDAEGLREVRNPSAIFLSRHEQPVPGSVVTVIREGSRQMLIEVQALVDASHAANPRRVAVGMETNRIAMLLAVLNRHGSLALHGHDVFVNIVGGVRVNETAADLPALVAAVSSLSGRPLPHDLVCFGEVGLAGEIRPVPHGEERLREAAKHGFSRALVPKANCPRQSIPGVEVKGISRVAEAVEFLQES
ncbi:MAG: DNA repair protein RadA [Steroidobacteraceae bacterium]